MLFYYFNVGLTYFAIGFATAVFYAFILRKPLLGKFWGALIVGLMVGVGIVFLIEALDDTVKGPADVVRVLNLPVLGYIGHLEEDSLPVTAAEPRAPVSEAFRALRTNIQYAGVDQQIRKLLVTSATPQDGKSTVAVNLGVVVSQSGKKVTVVDADMRRPTLHRRLHRHRTPQAGTSVGSCPGGGGIQRQRMRHRF